MLRTIELVKKRISEDLIAECSDGILAVDSQLRYLIWNPAMERISGLGANEVIGKSAVEVFPFLKEIGEDQVMLAVIEGERASTHRRPYSTSAGKHGYFEAVYSPVRTDEGDVVAALGLIRDASERSLIQELRMPDAKECAFAVLSHDRKVRLATALGKAIYERRKKMGMSQERLAERSSLHRTYITDVERGARSISLTTLEKLAGALGIPGSVLLGIAEALVDAP
jgi:PAS domain S-box-containing protein